mmetsp:Transcript_25718/g.37953  ORF Transcript_25718/g.37953 Transcript_25718/m.37953 type:complete len:1494 (+) Transcript_25718:46-4527(+)|eukprot:CAMPEP_0195525518 /NCGR_PEP_ID=MMETSP0794_2-20130614/25996_1 /TAXON_ID=515487 /ORGANISM="Stephanopyxis turris, Strain CCMP 815" /LENGTH=1493 /DNA_ID=CAMNT_0040655997 /DNA_START=28 /DNA_END=4509 /DNA_ORIENTATION=-
MTIRKGLLSYASWFGVLAVTNMAVITAHVGDQRERRTKNVRNSPRTLQEVGEGNERQKYACPLVGFIPFTNQGTSNRAFTHMAAALLAIDDFNARNDVVVPELRSDPMYQSCSVYIPDDAFLIADTQSKLSIVPKFLVQHQDKNICAIVGPYINEITKEASVFASGIDVPAISHGADANALSDSDFALAVRSRVNLHAMGEAIAQFLRSKGRIDFLACIYVSHEFGVASQQVLGNAAKESGFTSLKFEKIGPPFTGFEPNRSVRYAMDQIKKSTYRTIFITVFKPHIELPLIADAAEEYQMNGPDYVYVISAPIEHEIDAYISLANKNTNLTKLLNGAAMIRQLDGFTFNPILTGQEDPFYKHWKSQNASFVARVNDLNPIIDTEEEGYFNASTNYFQTHPPQEGAAFMYDAVIMAGMGKCQELQKKKEEEAAAAESTNNSEAMQGTEGGRKRRIPKGSSVITDNNPETRRARQNRRHLKKKPKNPITNDHVQGIVDLKITGATGRLVFGENRGRHPRNRLRDSVVYGVYNFRSNVRQGYGAENLSNYPFWYYLTDVIADGSVDGTFTQSSDGPFLFADGTPNPPILLRDVPEQNFLSHAVHVLGLTLMSLCLFFTFLAGLFVLFHRDKAVVREGRPMFLYFLALGASTMTFSIFTLSFDESYGWDESQLSKACTAFPWLLFLGFMTIYLCLFIKLWMTRQKGRKILDGHELKNSTIKVVIPSVILVLAVVTVLSVWTVVDPFTWLRHKINEETGATYGRCSSNNTLKYFLTLFALMAILMLLTAYLAFKTKETCEQFAESSWIFYSTFLQMQVLSIGIPILFILHDLSADATYLGRIMLIFTISTSTILFVFLPKVHKVFFPEEKITMSDSVWSVKSSELLFNDPPEVIGRGTFGLVLMAEYRGTNVAVKRVIPPRTEVTTDKSSSTTGFAMLKKIIVGGPTKPHLAEQKPEEQQKGGIEKPVGNSKRNDGVMSGSLLYNTSVFSGTDSWKTKGSSGFANGSKNYASLKTDFIVEMRLLSKLRHPCITTVMGAVINKREEPMLVMEYMDHGSLYDILHNDTMVLEGALLLPILRDIAQGVRFLHAATPRVIHGDLKAANVLVDSKFRAKVSDFGLSQKKQVGVTGTPYWMAPELLRRESANTTKTDVYSFGIILYELYSRKDPYQGEDHVEVLELVADPVICKRPPVPASCPPDVQTLMTDCLKGGPENRPTFEELDVRLKRLDVETVEPFEMQFSLQEAKRLKQRTETLLFDVFPKHVAEALRDGRKVDPESRDIVTIFFSDIVGFTNISSTLEPIKISRMLDRLYNSFDKISRKHDVFKVETIGDAYMAVTNLVKDQPDHAKRIANFSIEALKAANETLIDIDHPDKGCVNIRVGFHTGPVVANVVGSRNPRYCLFGDTVNTASRMESNSIENRIHCSERAAQHLRDQDPGMRLLSRGNITVKGKGVMHTYWVNEGDRFCLASKRGSKLSHLPLTYDDEKVHCLFKEDVV